MSIDDEPLFPSINGKTDDLLDDVRDILDQARKKAYASVMARELSARCRAV